MTIIDTGSHVLVFPFPAQGHMIPLLDLTHQLAKRGLIITILVTPQNFSLLNPLLSSHPPSSVKTLVLPFPAHPSIPVGVENAKDLPQNSALAIMRSLSELYDPLLTWFHNHPSPPIAIISDMFLGWTHLLACQLSIPNIVFSPSGALALSVMYSLWSDLPRPEDPNDPTALISFLRIPNSPKYPWWQLSPLYRRYVEGKPDSEFAKDGFRGNLASWGLVVNSFTELEEVYLDALKKELGHDRVWAVGPLLPPDDDQSKRGGLSSCSVDEIYTWLDACKDNKVVYVGFGSQAVLTNDQMAELASGLEKSGVRFIWSVKEPTMDHRQADHGMVPPGFEDRVAGRGLIIKGWAPQVSILSHRAVGAFLTHCGWNSVLEGLLAGVPMLVWPMGADQFVNANFLVDELKAGIRVCEGSKTVPDSAELAQVLVESVSEVRVERKRALELQSAALDAIKDGGSSVKDLDEIVKHLAHVKL